MLDRLRDPQAAGTILAVGVAIFLAGAGLWAIQLGVDHRWAAVMMIAGGPIALFGLILLLIGPKRVAAADLPSVRQDVRQRGNNPRNAQQTAKDNRGVMVQGDYHDHGGREAKTERKALPRPIENRDTTRAIELPSSVRWRLTGWMFYAGTRAHLRFQPYCAEHGKRMLVEDDHRRSYQFAEDLTLDDAIFVLRCPDTNHKDIQLYNQDLSTVRERVRSLLESAAEAGGWDKPTAEEMAYTEDHGR